MLYLQTATITIGFSNSPYRYKRLGADNLNELQEFMKEFKISDSTLYDDDWVYCRLTVDEAREVVEQLGDRIKVCSPFDPSWEVSVKGMRNCYNQLQEW